MSARDTILITGGAGFIGSHLARAAAEAGSRVVVLDDLSGTPSWPRLPPAVEQVRGDLADRRMVEHLIKQFRVTSIVHLAGKICVEESIRRPELYYEHNVVKTLALLDVVREHGPDVFVLSSTAAVYGVPRVLPIAEGARREPINPYGATKLAVELALADHGRAHGIAWAALRYFNAVGAHPSGELVESHDPETHLIPLAIDAALGRRGPLVVFGDDYPTRDGTCERDYVHVCDLARAHLDVLDVLGAGAAVGSINLGGGRASSVLEVLSTVARAIGKDVPRSISRRRPGDPAVLLADSARAKEILGWKPAREDLGTIVEDAVRSRTDP